MALLLAAALSALSGCNQQEERPAPAPAAPKAVSAETKKPRVIVPEAVRGKWKAVRIAVLDKQGNNEDVYTVEIGSAFQVGESKLSVRVENFLPAFIMDGTTMTSASNETRNPAAQIAISIDGEEVFTGWLFSLYPGTHAFQHPRYSFSLVDFIASS
ncbi:MAG: DUF2155 domain-containing protein [Desulfuromonas sp.]|nr:MAG: DUF2155 domain-containing protein [Desulfuromonas sp.]